MFFQSILLAVCVVFSALTSNAMAMSDEAIFQHAREAYAAKNEISLAQDATDLKVQEYLLAPYAAYWLMLLRLDQAEPSEIDAFLEQYAEFPFTDRLRGEWLKKLAKQQNWPLFFEQYPNFKRDDLAVQCSALLGQVVTSQLNEADIAAAKSIWFTTADLPTLCTPLFDDLQNTGALSTEDIWARFRLALQDGKLNVAKTIAARLPNFDDTNLKLLDRAYQAPQLILDKKIVSFKTRSGIEVNLYALDRLAKADLAQATSIYKIVQTNFDAENRAFGWGRIAWHAARVHHPNALKYYSLANKDKLDKEQLAWFARAALRGNDWAALQTAIAAMQPKQAEEGAWRYWKGRAFKAKNQQAEAVALFSQLAKERHYYGWLAIEELDGVMTNPAMPYSPAEVEVTAIASEPAIKRAIALNRLEMRWEAKAEWAWATRHFDDKQLLAAAEYALRQKWYDVAISTADNTQQLHDFNLRYPTPYRELMHKAADDEGLDEAWVYGLIRQESRFMHFAKSGVGASGLMQLMPTTAEWAAKRMGLSEYSNDMIHDLDTNINIGTYYMRHTLELMNGQAVMATAAYNAGPSRAKRWLAPEPLEAAVYIETIPFAETRSYVQKVMANAHLYAPRLGAKIQTLKARLGSIPGSGKPQVDVEDNQ